MPKSVNYTELTFLERVARAAREETYSAALAWMLDDFSSPLPLLERARMVQRLVGDALTISPEKVVSVTALTEVDEVDILLTLTTADREVHVAIENKIKATDHQVQLSTYDEKLSSRFGTEEVHKLFLTLGGEPPRSGHHWTPISYAVLHEAIVGEGLETRSVYVHDFCASLERLASVVTATRDIATGLAAFAFGDDPYSGKNRDAARLDGVLAYVQRTKLEKAVQRAWMETLAARFREVIPDRWSISISETRGQALVDVVTVLDLTPRVRVGLQLQGRSFKIFVAPEAYDDGETDLSRATVASTLAVLQTH